MEGVHARSFLAFLVVSVTSLLPYNLFMNAHQASQLKFAYFFYKLRNATDLSADGLRMSDHEVMEALFGVGAMLNGTGENDEASTELQRTYEGWFTVTSGVACILGSVLNTATTKYLSNGFRVLSGHAIVLLALLPTVLFTFIDTDADQTHFFWLSMVFSSIASMGSMGLIGAGIMGLAGGFPHSYVQGVMIGQSVAGVFSSVLSIACQALTSNAIFSGRIYFGLAVGWTLLSIACYFWLIRSDYAKGVIDRYELLVSDAYDDRSDRAPLMAAMVEDEEQEEEDEDGLGDPTMRRAELNDERVVESLRVDERPTLMQTYGAVWNQAKSELLLCAFILFVTLSAFPAVSSLVKTQATNPTWKAYFTSICCFLLFNICDCVGRVTAMQYEVSSSVLTKLSAARILLIPVIFFCDVSPRYHTGTLFRFDAVFVLANMALALSQGFCIAHASVKVFVPVSPELRESAGSLLALACVFAALMGSAVGIGLVSIA